jgi:hypothetical protein
LALAAWLRTRPPSREGILSRTSPEELIAIAADFKADNPLKRGWNYCTRKGWAAFHEPKTFPF